MFGQKERGEEMEGRERGGEGKMKKGRRGEEEGGKGIITYGVPKAFVDPLRTKSAKTDFSLLGA